MATPEDDEPKSPKPNWINDLAKRSTGLPSNDPPPRTARSGDSTLWSLAGLGFQFAISTAILAYMGVYIDKRTGYAPWGVVTLVFIALIGNLYLLIKEGLKKDADAAKRKQNQSQPPKGGP